MTGRALTYLLLTTVGIAIICVGGLIGLTSAAATCTPPMTASASADAAMVAGYDPQQLTNATTIVTVGAGRGIPMRGLVIAVATAIQESSLHNLGDLGPDNDHDSLGLFQQRASQGWGTPEQIMDPVYATNKYFDKLLSIDGWEQMPLTQAAQAVQMSAYPNAYAKHEANATALVALVDSANGLAIPGTAGHCVSLAGWTHPLPGYKVNSGFRTEDRPDHHGVDIAAPPGTPIRAAASGVVIKVLCNASLNGLPYSCDVSGSPAVKGCGWYSEIRTGAIIHRYCHQLVRPALAVGQVVAAGEVIGVVGTSGNSSGPHLHMEIHEGMEEATSANAQDPLLFFASVGVDLNG